MSPESGYHRRASNGTNDSVGRYPALRLEALDLLLPLFVHDAVHGEYWCSGNMIESNLNERRVGSWTDDTVN